MAKQEHVPETRESSTKPNREQRRHPERFENAALARDPGAEAGEPAPPDVPDVGGKSTGHPKKTADKWNQ